MFCCFRESIENKTADNTEWLSFDTQVLKVKCIDVYDADTITIVIPLGNKFYKTKCRLTGIDGAEKRTKNDDEKKVAIEGTEFVKSQILNKTLKVLCGDWDKYGRLLITIYTREEDWEHSLNNEIASRGYAYLYDGQKKRDFNEWRV